jgi:hypothetical protein
MSWRGAAGNEGIEVLSPKKKYRKKMQSTAART